PKRVTRALPKRGTRAAPNKTRQTSVAVMQARIDALEAELRQERDRRTATAEVLGIINSSPGDLAPVFDVRLEKAMHLRDAAFGTLASFDGHTFPLAGSRGVPPDYAKFRIANPFVFGPGTGAARLLAGEDIVHNIDLKTEDAYREGQPTRRALVDMGGARTALQVALRKDDALLGYIVIYRQEVQPFTEKQIALLQNFAAQAVIAMENARLLTETRQALEQQTATAEVLGVINSSPGDLTPVFDAMLEKATRLCEAPFGHLRTWDGERFHLGAAHGEPEFCEWFRQRGP